MQTMLVTYTIHRKLPRWPTFIIVFFSFSYFNLFSPLREHNLKQETNLQGDLFNNIHSGLNMKTRAISNVFIVEHKTVTRICGTLQSAAVT